MWILLEVHSLPFASTPPRGSEWVLSHVKKKKKEARRELTEAIRQFVLSSFFVNCTKTCIFICCYSRLHSFFIS